METDAKNGMIFPAMVAIMKDVEAIKKEKTGQGFKYRGIDDVMNSLHESFAKHGVFITTEVIDRKEVERLSNANKPLFYVTITVRFTFNAEDGSYISSLIYGTAMDSGDKADNKCMSIALKYCLLQAFLIPTEEMVDPDSQTHDVKPKAEPKSKPTMTEQIWQRGVEKMKEGDHTIPEKMRKAYDLTPDQEINLQGFEEQLKKMKEKEIAKSN